MKKPIKQSSFREWVYEHPLIIMWIVAAIIIIIIFGVWSNTEGFKRVAKSLDSTFNGGLDRTITLYDYSGNVIDSWTGTFDVQESETKVFFDDSETGKRVIIYNGIVVNEEN